MKHSCVVVSVAVGHDALVDHVGRDSELLETLPDILEIYLSSYELKGGGSIIMPLPLIHRMYPEVDPFASNPWELPRMLIPNFGGLKPTRRVNR